MPLNLDNVTEAFIESYVTDNAMPGFLYLFEQLCGEFQEGAFPSLLDATDLARQWGVLRAGPEAGRESADETVPPIFGPGFDVPPGIEQ